MIRTWDILYVRKTNRIYPIKSSTYIWDRWFPRFTSCNENHRTYANFLKIPSPHGAFRNVGQCKHIMAEITRYGLISGTQYTRQVIFVITRSRFHDVCSLRCSFVFWTDDCSSLVQRPRRERRYQDHRLDHLKFFWSAVLDRADYRRFWTLQFGS